MIVNEQSQRSNYKRTTSTFILLVRVELRAPFPQIPRHVEFHDRRIARSIENPLEIEIGRVTWTAGERGERDRRGEVIKGRPDRGDDLVRAQEPKTRACGALLRRGQDIKLRVTRLRARSQNSLNGAGPPGSRSRRPGTFFLGLTGPRHHERPDLNDRRMLVRGYAFIAVALDGSRSFVLLPRTATITRGGKCPLRRKWIETVREMSLAGN